MEVSSVERKIKKMKKSDFAKLLDSVVCTTEFARLISLGFDSLSTSECGSLKGKLNSNGIEGDFTDEEFLRVCYLIAKRASFGA